MKKFDYRSVTIEQLNAFTKGALPEVFGIEFINIEKGRLTARLEVKPQFLAPNNFLHAGTLVSLADTVCGFGAVTHLPEGAESFTTIELKSNFLGTAREGVIECEANAVHLGRTTQVWDATVVYQSSGKKLALFRCSQMILFPKNKTVS